MIYLLAGLAHGQDMVLRGEAPSINSQLFRPSVDSRHTLWTEESVTGASGDSSFRAALHYANDPLVYTHADERREELVSGIWQMSLQAGHVRGPVRVGLDVPVYLRSFGSAADSETGLGDVGVDVRATALSRYTAQVGIAVAGRVGVPTATVQAPLGTDGFGWEAALIVDREMNEKVLLAVNLGTRGVPEASLENLDWDDQFFVRAGGSYAINDLTQVSLDVASHFTYGVDAPESRPAEALLGAGRRLGAESPIVFRGGVGTGLNSGIGAPKYRVVAALSYELPGERDRDGDTLLDRDDECKDEAEDLDGIKDDDGCPDYTRVVVEVYDRRLQPIDDATWSLEGAQSASGRSFQSSEVFGGAFTLTVESPVYGQLVQDVDVPDARSHSIRVDMGVPMGTLTVVAQTLGGKPIDDAIWRSAAMNYSETLSGETVSLRPGDYDLVVSAPGFKTNKRAVRVVSLQDETVVVALERVPEPPAAEEPPAEEPPAEESGEEPAPE